MIGFEGMAGLSIVLGVDRSPHQSMVQIQDGAMRMKADALLNEFKRGGALQGLVLRSAQALMLQISQVAACNGRH